jgi:hypothetical protein
MRDASMNGMGEDSYPVAQSQDVDAVVICLLCQHSDQ